MIDAQKDKIASALEAADVMLTKGPYPAKGLEWGGHEFYVESHTHGKTFHSPLGIDDSTVKLLRSISNILKGDDSNWAKVLADLAERQLKLVQGVRSDTVRRLIMDSARGMTVKQSTVYSKRVLSKDDIVEAVSYIKKQPNFNSYHLLLKLQHYKAYASISNQTKAQVLCSTLGLGVDFGDWGQVVPRGSMFRVVSSERIAASALIVTGEPALPFLRALLDNPKEAGRFWDNTVDDAYHLRVCDYAYRYAALILGVDASCAATSEERDREIAKLKTLIDEKLKKRSGSQGK